MQITGIKQDNTSSTDAYLVTVRLTRSEYNNSKSRETFDLEVGDAILAAIDGLEKANE
jgi:hypothetical protein